MKSGKQTPPGLPLCEHPLRGLPAYPTSGEEARIPPDKGRPGGVGFIPYDKKLTALARENRNNPTAAESKMWNEVLRMRHFEKLKFLIQKPIGNYIIDFYCAELHLAIEMDGDSHAEAVEYDAARTAAFNARGISVARYTNDEILNNLEGVYDDLVRRVALINDGVDRP